MLKYTKDDKTCQQQLEESLNTMLEVVRIVNNSMYQVAIVGFPVSLTSLRQLFLFFTVIVYVSETHAKPPCSTGQPWPSHMLTLGTTGAA